MIYLHKTRKNKKIKKKGGSQTIKYSSGPSAKTQINNQIQIVTRRLIDFMGAVVKPIQNIKYENFLQNTSTPKSKQMKKYKGGKTRKNIY